MFGLILKETDPSPTLKLVENFLFFGWIFFLLLSGVLLISSVFRIRSFLKRIENPVNTKNLCLHSVSFGSFLLSELLFAFAQIGNNTNCPEIAICRDSFFISQLLNMFS